MFEENENGEAIYRPQYMRLADPNNREILTLDEMEISYDERIELMKTQYAETMAEKRKQRNILGDIERGKRKTYCEPPKWFKSEKEFVDWLDVELYHAYICAARGKRRTADEYKFEANLFDNLYNLRDSIVKRKYKPSASIAFIVHDPVEREIFAAPFRDRVVHHLIYNLVAPWWDKRFSPHSFSCRDHKGTLDAVYSLERDMARVTDGYRDKDCWGFKFDISGFFMNLYRPYLYERAAWGARRQFTENEQIRQIVLYLWKQVIFDDPAPKAVRKGKVTEWYSIPARKSLFTQPPNYGIVIGNLTSQLLSNIYLDELDRFVHFSLGYKYYGRYVDDFYILAKARDKEKVLSDVKIIDNFLKGMHLKLHPTKRTIQPLKYGMNFVGAKVYMGRIVPGKRLRRNFSRSARRYSISVANSCSINSYMGLMLHLSSDRLVNKVLSNTFESTEKGFRR